MNFNLNLPTRVYFGEGTIKNIEKELGDYKKIMVLYGSGSIKRNGLYNEVMDILKKLNKEVVEYEGIEPNPRYESVVKASELVVKEKVDFILGVGGGSVIDAAKGIALKSRNMDADMWSAVRSRGVLKEKAVSVGTILTLAATGSETNSNFVLTNMKEKEKLGHANPSCFPKFAVLDPNYTRSVPKVHTRNGVVDTIAHLLEQYFNILDDSDPLVDLMLVRIENLIKNTITLGPKLLEDLTNYKYREELMYYAYMGLNGEISGKVEKGDWASHGLEHALSAVYDISHGAGLSIVFPYWMDYVVEKNPSRIKRMAVNIFGIKDSGNHVKTAKEGIEKLRNYFKSIEAPTTLLEEGIEKLDLDKVMHAAVARDKTLGKYIVLEKEDIKKIFKSM